MKKVSYPAIFVCFALIMFISWGLVYDVYTNTKKDNDKKSEKDKSEKEVFLKEAMFYEKLDDKKVKCGLCPRGCILRDGAVGFCRVRQNIGGVLYTLNYGKVVAANVDPIEKKPFFHFLPGTKSFSIACAGCNMRCRYCQNWEISQRGVEESDEYIEPSKIVELALKTGSRSIAYTYSEPFVFYEYMIDIAKIAKERGIKNIVVTGGFINKKPLEELLRYIDAVKVDLKGFNEEFYRKYTSGDLKAILETIKVIKKSGRHLEIVNLVIPGVNDSDDDIKRLSLWIKENLGADVPLHFTRFYPNYKMMDTPPTPKETLVKARKIAMDIGLRYVYTGNIYNPDGENTYCPDGSIAIERRGFFVIKNNLKDGRCPDGTYLPGVWK
ncbi:MAG: AmmeMemoRadiSam system radical SAM enzyme [Elusimicrobiales bacterium]